jgi:hypothetical protein
MVKLALSVSIVSVLVAVASASAATSKGLRGAAVNDERKLNVSFADLLHMYCFGQKRTPDIVIFYITPNRYNIIQYLAPDCAQPSMPALLHGSQNSLPITPNAAKKAGSKPNVLPMRPQEQ